MKSEEILLKTFKVLPKDRKKELLDFAEFFESKEVGTRPRRSLQGSLTHLNIEFTEADLREARNEMWRGYTQDTDNER